MVARTEAAEAVTAFAEHEHLDLARGIERIHNAACSVGKVPTTDTIGRIREVLQWFEQDLQPHLTWEETWLYPQIERVTGTPWSTRAARFDHAQVREVVLHLRSEELRDLGHPNGIVQTDVRCRLFSLEALLRAHVEREERLLLPVLREAGEAMPAARQPVVARP